ncbi:uncharacterized protein E5676_scaffold21G003550 [Cucumis melo var. makuwa]|uniref:Uncharacterized protein LOC103493080 n=2 Tax=Cucumis melo TaxID=3656 RepID=A0A1S3BTS2_CUCME|nr:uncharacterized protein LOC103493080 [Cucumis melo]KAA0044931.1 uncharacterized protein E6C27_scaffold74G002300 [Cucumis melo var. makuwa]TYK16539.1 uncharacterized protein E5676_scaffold21G003550 [Cucumis melo var. makuwa]
MGNCSLKGMAVDCVKPIRILTDSGHIINFHGPKQVHQILNNYPPGIYGVFRRPNLSSPLPFSEPLDAGKSYFLLPLSQPTNDTESSPPPLPSKDLGSESGLEVLPASGNGVWRVKLVIDTKQLGEILAEEGNTEALIERIRAAAATAAVQSPRRGKIVGWKPMWGNWLKFFPMDFGNNNKAQIKEFNS